MSRITMKNLEYLVDRINQLTNSPMTPWERVDGSLKASIGNYHLDQAYGGIKLVRMDTLGGGISVVTRNGYGTKKELYYQLDAIVIGLEMKMANHEKV